MFKNIENQNSTRKRKHLSAEQKCQIVYEILAHPGKKAEILRREGLFSSDFTRFNNIMREGAIKELKKVKPGRKNKFTEVSIEEYKKLKAELEQKKETLADLSVDFMALKKKVNGE